MRIEDPFNNGGRGWRRLAPDEVADLAYIAIKLASRGTRADLAGKTASKADEAAMKLAKAISARLAAYPTFGPERTAVAHSTVGEMKR